MFKIKTNEHKQPNFFRDNLSGRTRLHKYEERKNRKIHSKRVSGAADLVLKCYTLYVIEINVRHRQYVARHKSDYLNREREGERGEKPRRERRCECEEKENMNYEDYHNFFFSIQNIRKILFSKCISFSFQFTSCKYIKSS